MSIIRLAILVAVCSSFALPAADEITFTKHIAPIIFANCTGCHRAGEVAPFELATYADVKKRAMQIARVTEDGYMPPWKPVAGHGEFLGERRLSADQVKLLRAWADAGTPEGEAKDLPPTPQFTDGWQIGPPDLVVKMPEPFTVRAEGRDVYRCFVIPLELQEDVYVAAAEYRPSNRRVVHHAILFLDAMGMARKKDEKDPGPGYGGFGGPGILPSGGLGGWAPGATVHRLPDNVGRFVKKGSDLVLQLHLHPTGKEEQEQSTVGLYFCKKKPEKTLGMLPLRSRDINIPAGEKNYKVNASFTVPVDLELIGVTPHAHYICRTMKASATFPDGKEQPLFRIDDWDFNWQDQYLYRQPLKLPKGTVVAMEYTYDNSAENIRNPNKPPQKVTWGEQTADEMAILFMNVVSDKAKDMAELRSAVFQQGLKQAFKGGGLIKDLVARFDTNANGKLEREEIEAARKAFEEQR